MSTRSAENKHKKFLTAYNNPVGRFQSDNVKFVQFKSTLNQGTKHLIDSPGLLTAMIKFKSIGMWTITRQQTTAE